MRNISLILWLFPLLTQAQDSIVLLSKYDQFSYQSDRMIKNNDSVTGRFEDMRFFHSVATDIEDGTTANAVYIQQIGNGYNNSLVIDMDEIDVITKALDYYRSQPAKQAQYSNKYRFITNGDIEVYLYFNKKWLFVLDKIYHNSNAITVPKNIIVVTEKEIDGFLDQLKRAS